MKVFIASDHRGFAMKNSLVLYLMNKGHTLVDVGNKKYDRQDDYPDFGKKLAKKVRGEQGSFGIAICGSGAGICMAVNRVRGIRAISAPDIKTAKISRKDNDSNVLCLGSDFLTAPRAKKIVDVWMKTKFGGAKRHRRRIRKLDE